MPAYEQTGTMYERLFSQDGLARLGATQERYTPTVVLSKRGHVMWF